MKNLIYKAKKIGNWLAAGDFITIYSMLMRHNPLAYYRLDDNAGYRKWLKAHKKKASPIVNGPYKPLISLLLVATEDKAADTIQSIIAQTYGNWQLCVAARDGMESKDIRISIANCEGKGHGYILNDLLSMTKGEYVMIIREGDKLDPAALSFYIEALNKNKGYKVIYPDEDRIDQDGKHLDPFFKPNFSPNLLYSLDYISRGAMFKHGLIDGFDASLPSGHAYDLLLRIAQRLLMDEVHHIPHVLYHCLKISDGSINDALISCQITEKHLGAEAHSFDIDGERIFHKISCERLNSHPKISIIIPTKDKLNLLKPCIDSIKSKTSYPDYEIIVIDNQSSEPDALAYLKGLNRKNIKVLSYDKPYNYSAINNYAVKFAKGEVICFLNNDVEIISTNWLEEMMLWLQRPGVGIVGAKLYFPGTNNIQHAGMHCATNPYTKKDYITHGYIHQPRTTTGYLNNLYLAHEVSSVTGACLLMHKELFIAVGEFDAENTPTSYSDVDLCFRVRKKGYNVMWTPYAELTHHESASRGLDIERSKAGYDYMTSKWPEYFKNDVAINANLTVYYGGYLTLRNKG